MKTINSFFILLLIFVSCKKEQINPQTSIVNNNPVDSIITYVDSVSKFIGSFICTEQSSQTGNGTGFIINISKSNIDTNRQVIISNFYGLGYSNRVVANILDDSLFINLQIISGNYVKGCGVLQDSITIKLNYTVNDGSVTDTVNAILIKQ